MTAEAFILEEYVLESEFANANKISPRKLRDLRNEPDGLPWMMWAGRICRAAPAKGEIVLQDLMRRQEFSIIRENPNLAASPTNARLWPRTFSGVTQPDRCCIS